MKTQAKALRRAIFWGIISLAAYVFFFLNQESATQYFTQGGFSTLVLVVTVLAFSIIHGAFASYLGEAMAFAPEKIKERGNQKWVS